MRPTIAVVMLVALAGCLSGGTPAGTPAPTPSETPAAPPTTDTATDTPTAPTTTGPNQSVVCGGYPANTSSLSCHAVNRSGYVSPTGFNTTTTP